MKIYPPSKPYKPSKPTRATYRLENCKAKEVIYRDISVLGDRDDINLEQWFADQDEILPPPPDIRWWNNKLSLQDIVDMAPPGTKLCDIIFHIDMPRYLEYIDVSFSKYERDLDAEEFKYQEALKQYKKDLQKYEENMIKYNEETAVYNKSIAEEQIKNLEKQIKELKKLK